MTTNTKKSDPIKKITLKDGTTTVYRFMIDVGFKPKIDKVTRKPVLNENGEQVMVRDQRTMTFPKKGEAVAERARIISERARGSYVRPTKLTVSQAIAEFLAGKRNIGIGTRRTYADALKRVTDQLGHLPLQQLTKKHIDALVTYLLSEGRRVGNRKRKGISARSVNLTLTLLDAVCESYVMQGKLGRNPVPMAERPDHDQAEMNTWSAGQAGAFLTATALDRLAAAWQLSLYGLRRGEVLGLRWSDVDLAAKTLTVRWERTSVNGVIVEKEPKTERGKRTLPLDDDLVEVLTALWLRSLDEREAAGEAYAGPCPDCQGNHVVVDELGRPYRPDWYSTRFAALAGAAKLPRIRLHDTRHTCGTLMHDRGVKVAVISKWLGHAKASFTMDTYVHATDEGMEAAAATLRGAYTPAQRTASSDV